MTILADREKKRVYDKSYRVAYREKNRVREAAYRADNKDKLLAYASSYRAAHREEIASYGAAYRESHREGLRERDAEQFARFTEWLQILRANNGCEDCGAHEGLLDHHHLDPTTKKCQISGMYLRSLDALEDELEKCVVLCRSCHKLRHYRCEL